MIILQTRGGLCNRLRSIDSARILAQKLDKKLFIIWENNHELGADFDELFKPISGIKVMNKQPYWLKFMVQAKTLKGIINKFSLLHTGLKDENIKAYFRNTDWKTELSRYKTIYIHTIHAFLYPEDFSYLKPVDEIQREINKTIAAFTENTISFHIRGTDHVQAKKESPLQLFIDKAEKEIAKDKNLKIYLATDEMEAKEKLSQRYPQNIITKNFELSRSNSNGLKNAVYDLFILSKTATIYGSHGSSFSETAKHLGKKSLVLVKNQNNK